MSNRYAAYDDYGLRHLPRHLILSGRWSDLAGKLTDLAFIEAKCAAGMAYDLVRDYTGTERALGSMNLPARQDLADFARFIRGQIHVLAVDSEQTFQEAANQPDATAPASVALRMRNSGMEHLPWLMWVNKPQQPDATVLNFVGHSSLVVSCAFSPDGQRIVSGSSDNTAKNLSLNLLWK